MMLPQIKVEFERWKYNKELEIYVSTLGRFKDKNKTILMCSECLSRNYSTHKNKKDSSERLELMKFCPRCNKHTLHKETK